MQYISKTSLALNVSGYITKAEKSNVHDVTVYTNVTYGLIVTCLFVCVLIMCIVLFTMSDCLSMLFLIVAYFGYCKTTNVSMLLILAMLANGIKTLILIPANNYNQSRGHT